MFAAALWVALGWLFGHKWVWELDQGAETTRYGVSRMVLYIGAGVVGVVGVLIAYRRQRGVEEGHFLEQLAESARQLGDENPTVQAAGAYALAGLADRSTRERRQQCVDVLCAYMRLPYVTDGAQGIRVSSSVSELVHTRTTQGDAGAEEKVEQTIVMRPHDRATRQTIMRIIVQHLREGALVTWSNLDFDFSNTTFDYVDFSKARFAGSVRFSGATFSGSGANFTEAEFLGGITDFENVRFSGGGTSFMKAVFRSESTNFTEAYFLADNAEFSGARFVGSYTSFAEARFAGKYVGFVSAEFISKNVSFADAQFVAEDSVFQKAKFAGDYADFSGVKFIETAANFRETVFGSETVHFGHAEFSGEKTDFQLALFKSRRSDFVGAAFLAIWSDFRGAVFEGEYTGFVAAAFASKVVHFGEVEFRGEATDFQRAEFTGASTRFEHVLFKGRINFDESRCLGGEMSMGGVKFASDSIPSGKCDFPRRD
ncbi:pentapeptide repeat-containing protein [Kocuria sediminis]|uniref:pentapeptide repeat-containing protein n=1 Tax=Kocuria sediminis TaxID=1038857 RepID=UPI001391EA90